MKRIVKNLIIIILIVVLFVLSYFTMKNAKKTLIKTYITNNDSQMKDFSNRPEMPGGENGEMPERPEMPEEENGEMPEKPEMLDSEDGNNIQGGPTGEKPDFNQEDREKRQNNQNGDNTEAMPPEMPNGENFDRTKDFSEGMMKNENIQTQEDVKLTKKYYVLFTCEAGLASMLIVYLVMSKFNKYSFRETLLNKKIIIYLIVVVILTAILTCTEVLITNNVYLKSETTQSLKESN